jgi:hypothetical protein
VKQIQTYGLFRADSAVGQKLDPGVVLRVGGVLQPAVRQDSTSENQYLEERLPVDYLGWSFGVVFSGACRVCVGKIRGVDESDLIQHFDINQPARLMEPG